jgi:hypothetical protein
MSGGEVEEKDKQVPSLLAHIAVAWKAVQASGHTFATESLLAQRPENPASLRQAWVTL